MARGGARVGAGRPESGISQTRRLLVAGLNRGFAQAGRAKGLTGENDEAVAVQTIAHIVADEVLLGNGADMVKVYAMLAPKGEDGDQGKKSPLLTALESLPGAGFVPPASLPGVSQGQTFDGSATYEAEATDSQSVDHTQPTPEGVKRDPRQPFFGHALVLPLAERVDGDELSRAGEGGSPATPYPPRAPGQQALYPHADDFEKPESSRGAL